MQLLAEYIEMDWAFNLDDFACIKPIDGLLQKMPPENPQSSQITYQH